jgi:undecaprenyl pyrophosphate phosphatase UppP
MGQQAGGGVQQAEEAMRVLNHQLILNAVFTMLFAFLAMTAWNGTPRESALAVSHYVMAGLLLISIVAQVVSRRSAARMTAALSYIISIAYGLVVLILAEQRLFGYTDPEHVAPFSLLWCLIGSVMLWVTLRREAAARSR